MGNLKVRSGEIFQFPASSKPCAQYDPLPHCLSFIFVSPPPMPAQYGHIAKSTLPDFCQVGLCARPTQSTLCEFDLDGTDGMLLIAFCTLPIRIHCVYKITISHNNAFHNQCVTCSIEPLTVLTSHSLLPDRCLRSSLCQVRRLWRDGL